MINKTSVSPNCLVPKLLLDAYTYLHWSKNLLGSCFSYPSVNFVSSCAVKMQMFVSCIKNWICFARKMHHSVVMEHFPQYLQRLSFLVPFRVPVKLPFMHRAESVWRLRTSADNSIPAQQSSSRHSAASALLHAALLFINICSTCNIHQNDRQFRKRGFLLTKKHKFCLKLMSFNLLFPH